MQYPTIDNHAVLVEDYARLWLKHRDIKPRTREHYQGIIDRHIVPDLGRVRVDALTVALIRNWNTGMRQRNVGETIEGARLRAAANHPGRPISEEVRPKTTLSDSRGPG